jgi:aminoglycoside phosphotransferase (APT) family kinase protein
MTQKDTTAAAQARLATVLTRAAGETVLVEALTPLSGGASSLSYEVGARRSGRPWRLVLQVGSGAEAPAARMRRPVQAALQQRAAAAGVPVAGVVAVLTPQDQLGDGFVMEFVEGETLAPKWLRAPEYASARAAMTSHCAAALASIHTITADALGDLGLPAYTPMQQLLLLRDQYDTYGAKVPVFELAFATLAERLPSDGPAVLVHGDFRSGNFIVGLGGLEAVLDWELAHIGHPLLDIGWLCTNTWRFGHFASPVGGFGERHQLYSAYEAAGGMHIDPDLALAFEMLGSLRWGVMCMQMAFGHLTGAERSVERAAIGRRVSETEADLLYMLKYGAL